MTERGARARPGARAKTKAEPRARAKTPARASAATAVTKAAPRARARSKNSAQAASAEPVVEPQASAAQLSALEEATPAEAAALLDEVAQAVASPAAELLAEGLDDVLTSSTAHGAISTAGGFAAVDDFGLAPATHARMQPALDWLYSRYFRVQVSGIENIPVEGPALLVCNHGGALPWDGVMLATAVAREHPGKRSLRWLVEDFAFHAPFLGPLLNRIGAVRACPENATRLLADGHVLAVFPEGIQGIGKTYKDRYRLQRFGRGGHVKLALRLGVPLIPVGIAGSDDTYPLLYKVRAFSKSLGLPFIPVTPTFPLLGPAGLAPLPSRFHIEIGAPLDGLSDLTPAAADDTLLVHDINDRVRRAVAQLLEQALAARGPRAYR
jgi:1-acyl-sn-glycerol-3-phosphate acyltransferase